MADPYDPADPYVLAQMPGVQQPRQVLGAPAVQYAPLDIFGGRDQGMSAMMLQYMPQIMSMLGVGANQFLPQQIPAQALMDQMTSAKYMRESRASTASFIAQDQGVIFQNLVGARRAAGYGELDALGAAQVNNFAGMINSPLGQMIAGSIFGAQNTEDLFFGRRGSAAQLAGAVNKFGFYRPDSVDGVTGMSGDSLRQFTDQLYSNLYGPGADLNDISGLSAGRVGDVATDLAQRGLLPGSLGALPESRRREELRRSENRPANLEENVARDIADARFRKSDEEFGPDGAKPEDKKTYAEMTPQEQREFLDARMRQNDNPIITEARSRATSVMTALDDDNTSTEEIRGMEGGASAIRRVDATRVGNTLKEYSGAIDAVRAIFGDNGMGNAPMQQLMAALDSLTQGGMASMQPGKLENILRRTQMASRDAGVSIEALMGLTARGGALADQNGLARDMVPGAVIATMERGAAMRETGAFTPGFGKVDPNAAMMQIMDQTVRADSSNAARLASVARRIVKENEGNTEFAGRAKELQDFVAAMERGDSTFTNAAGQVVNIHEQMGQNSGEFFQAMFQRAGLSETEVSSRFYDAVNTQEYLIPGFTAAAQSYEVKQNLSGFFVEDFLDEDRGKNLTDASGKKLNDEQRGQLAATLGKSFSTAMIDEVDSNLNPAQRIEVLQRSLRRGAEQYVRQQAEAEGRTLTATQLYDETEALLTGPGGLFKSPEEMRRFVEVRQADLGRDFEGISGMNINTFRQINSIDVLTRTEEKGRQNRARADMLETLGGSVTGDGSNVLQRFSDYFLARGEGDGSYGAGINFAEHILGTVDTREQQDRLLAAAGGEEAFRATMGIVDKTMADATLDSDAEKAAAVAAVLSGGEPAFTDMRDRFQRAGSSLLDGKQSVISTQTLAANLGAANQDTALRAIYAKHFKKKDGGLLTDTDLDAKFSGAERAATLTALAELPGLERQLTEIGGLTSEQMAAVGLLNSATVDGAVTYSDSVIREIDLRRNLDSVNVAAGATPLEAETNAEKVKQVRALSTQMARGQLETRTIMQVMGIDPGNKKVTEALETALSDAGDETALTALAGVLDEEKIGKEKSEGVMTLARIDHAMKSTGGLETMSGKTTQEQLEIGARTKVLTEAVKNGEIDRDSDIAKAVQTLQDPNADEKAKAAARKKVEAATETEDAFRQTLAAQQKDGRTLAGGQVDAMVNRAAEDAKNAGAAVAGDGGGLLSQIGTAISSAFSKVAADMFKDVKIENVTITNLKMSNLLGALGTGLFGGDDKKPTAAKPDAAAREEPTDAAGAPKEPKEAGEPGDSATKPGQKKEEETNQTAETVTALGAAIQTLAAAAMGFSSQKTGGEKELTLAGELTLNGLDRVVAALTARGMEQTPGNGAPTMPNNIGQG